MPRKLDRLIVHGSHHKTGSTWFRNLLTDIAEHQDLTLYRAPDDSTARVEIPPDADIYLEPHALRIDVASLGAFIGSHVARDLRDVVVSGYHYHLHASEEWLHIPREEHGGKSFQQCLKERTKEYGLWFELEYVSRGTVGSIGAWEYGQPGFMELKYEDLITDPCAWFPRLFRHWGFAEDQIPELMQSVERVSFESQAKRSLGDVKAGAHLRSGRLAQWKDEFNEVHKDRFKELYGHWLINAGYESDRSW